MSPIPQQRYAIGASTLTTAAAAAMSPGARLIVELCGDGRALVPVPSFELIKDGNYVPELKGVLGDGLFREELLAQDLREVFERCGNILGEDPTLDTDEPWLLALARRETCVVICEENPLSIIPSAAPLLRLNVMCLEELVAELR